MSLMGVGENDNIKEEEEEEKGKQEKEEEGNSIFFPSDDDDRRSLDAIVRKISTVVIDTETTGLGGVVIQLAFECLDADDKIIFEYNKLIPPAPGYHVEPGAYHIHGISDDIATNYGVVDPVAELQRLSDFFAAIARNKNNPRLVAHNIDFDVRAIDRTRLAWGMQQAIFRYNLKKLCTMRQSTHFCNLKNVAGRSKAPKNAELYYKLMGVFPSHAKLHDAAGDVSITRDSFIAGKKIGLW